VVSDVLFIARVFRRELEFLSIIFVQHQDGIWGPGTAKNIGVNAIVFAKQIPMDLMVRPHNPVRVHLGGLHAGGSPIADGVPLAIVSNDVIDRNHVHTIFLLIIILPLSAFLIGRLAGRDRLPAGLGFFHSGALTGFQRFSGPFKPPR